MNFPRLGLNTTSQYVLKERFPFVFQDSGDGEQLKQIHLLLREKIFSYVSQISSLKSPVSLKPLTDFRSSCSSFTARYEVWMANWCGCPWLLTSSGWLRMMVWETTDRKWNYKTDINARLSNTHSLNTTKVLLWCLSGCCWSSQREALVTQGKETQMSVKQKLRK